MLFKKTNSILVTLIGYGIVAAILIFTGIMVTKVLPYMTFERAINFLGTKPNEVLNKNLFIVAFYVHISSSIVVIGGGVLQFLPRLLRGYPQLHRGIGKVYVASILLLAAPSGLVLAAYANGGLAARVGFGLQCFVWWFATFAAWREIMHRRYRQHIEWMLRSYAITLAAMSLRTESYIMYYVFETKPIETYLTVTWLSWVGNWAIVEMLIYVGFGRRLYEGVSLKI